MLKYLATHKILIFQSLFFLFVSLSFILPNGNQICNLTQCEIQIGDWHMHDALWHISLAELGFDTWPLTHPYISGVTLYGYNYLIDFIIYAFVQIGLKPLFVFFKLIPVLAATLYIYSVIKYISAEKMSYVKSNIFAFFLYFASSFSYLATIYANGSFMGSTLRGFPVVSSITPATMFLNLQFAFSLSIILWILMLIKKKSSTLNSLILGILFFSMFGFKFYGAVVAVLIYLSFTIAKVIKRHFTKNNLIEAISVILFSYLGFYIFYKGDGSQSIPFVYAPLALPRLLIDDPLLFFNHSLTLARYYLYENKVGFSPRLLAIETYSILLFVLFNFGTRILSFLYFAINLLKKRLSQTDLIYFLVTIITLLIPIFFIQEGGWYNTMQFLYYGLWFASLLTAQFCYEIYKSDIKYKYILLSVIFLMTVPNIFEQLRYIYAEKLVISGEELDALNTLKSADPGIVHINNPVHRNGYIPAFAHKIPYYLDTDQLMVTHAPYQERLDFINKYQGGSIATIPADYFYIYKSEWGTKDALEALSNPKFKVIFDSENIIIYQRLKD